VSECVVNSFLTAAHNISQEKKKDS